MSSNDTCIKQIIILILQINYLLINYKASAIKNIIFIEQIQTY